MGIVLKILVYAAALWVAVAILPGLDFDGTAVTLLAIALALGVVNVTIRPLLAVLSLPLVILTFGLFLLVVNAIALAVVVWLSGVMDLGLTSENFGWTFLGAIVVSLVTWGLETLLRTR